VPRRPAPARPPPSRCRCCSACSSTRTRPPRRRATRCAPWCCCPRASWPIRWPTRSSQYAKYTQLRSTVVFGGMDMKPQTAAAQGRRGAGGHARPPAGPHRGQDRRAQPGRVRGARRGRPHAGHRLPARPAAHPELPAQAAHHAAVLGHLLARDQAPGRQLPAGPGAIEVARPNATASTVEQHFYLLDEDDKRRAIRQVLDRQAAEARPSSSATASSVAPGWRARWSATASRPPPCTATRARTSG
jgi:hypothetical protein